MRTALSVDCPRRELHDGGELFVGRENEEQNDWYLSDWEKLLRGNVTTESDTNVASIISKLVSSRGD